MGTTYRRVLDHFFGFDINGPLVVGVTATPDRGDGAGLDSVFEEIVYTKPLLEMIGEGYLADLRAISVELDCDFNALHTRAGDFIDSEVASLLEASNAPRLIAEAYGTHARRTSD